MKSNKMIILVGPSGVGKSSFLTRALQDYPELRDTVTYTTRPMRLGESEGHPYHFVSKERFEELIQQDFFVEWAQVHGNLYGTPHDQIKDTWQMGQAVIMDVDTQGAKTFKAKYPQALTVFILPPSIDALRKRVAIRDGGQTVNLELRMRNAEREIAEAKDFDYQLTNGNFEEAYAELKKMIDEWLGRG